MRRIDLHAYPGTQPWIDSQGPFVQALGAYWGREWTAESEQQVMDRFTAADVDVVLVAFDIETVVQAPPCSNAYVTSLRRRYPDRIVGAWGAVDPFKGDAAYRSLSTGGQWVDDLLWHYPAPLQAASWLEGFGALYAEKVDAWFVEEDRVVEVESTPNLRHTIPLPRRPATLRISRSASRLARSCRLS